MKAVILAAGVSSRLRPYTDSLPKCLLPVSGTPILKRALETLAAAGVHDVAIVSGYRERQVREAVSSWFPAQNLSFVSNAAYASTNNCVSMLLAEGFVQGSEFLLVDGDLVFDLAAVEALLRAPHSDCFALRPAADLGDEEMKAELDSLLRLRTLSKGLDVGRAAGESVGMFRFSSSATVFQHLRARIVDRGLVDEWYEAAFQEAIDHGLEMYAVPIGNAYVSEIDTPEDLARVDSELRALAEPRPVERPEPLEVGQAWGNDRTRIESAPALGVRGVEGDLMLCFKDGEYDGALMVHPGLHLPRRTAEGHLAYGVEEARALVRHACGIDAPSLEDFLADIQRLNLEALVESKIPGTFARVRSLLQPHARRLTLISFDADEIGAATAMGFASGCLMKHRPSARALETLRTLYGFRVLLLDGWYISKPTVDAAHALGLSVIAYDVDDDRRAALSDMGLDGVVSPQPVTALDDTSRSRRPSSGALPTLDSSSVA